MLAYQTAKLAHRDGETMKGISILGLIFLPGTFVSVSITALPILLSFYLPCCDQAIFSMSFFTVNTNPSTGLLEWEVSKQFWLYWIVALPLTGLTLALWYYWRRRSDQISSKMGP